MDLVKFRVKNFRSIEDSGEIEVSKIVALVGRNESGKSNLLLALASLNPAGKRMPLNAVKDFPRSRRIDECRPNTRVVWTWWKLKPDQADKISSMFGQKIASAEVGRGYDPGLAINIDATHPTLDPKKATGIAKRLKPVLEPRWEALADPHKANCAGAWSAFETAVAITDAKGWAAAVTPGAASLRQQLGAGGIMLDEAQDALLTELEELAGNISGFDDKLTKAKALVEKWLPKFVYVSDFPELYGHQDLDAFVTRRGQDPSMKEREDNFEKLAKVAGFDPAQLHVHRADHEMRGQILNRASSLVTGEIRRLWKDRPLMVRLDIDGPHVTVMVSDPNAQYPVEVNLDERSRGFKWFFAFFITFSADTQGGNADGAILLLDEPGLYLHAKSQEHLLKHLREDYKNPNHLHDPLPVHDSAHCHRHRAHREHRREARYHRLEDPHRRFPHVVPAAGGAGLSVVANAVRRPLQPYRRGRHRLLDSVAG